MLLKINFGKSAQSAIEFMIMVGAILFFSTLFFLVVQKNVEQRELERETVFAQNIALSVQNEIIIASAASEGYHRDFVVDQTILGREYDIKTGDKVVAINTGRVGLSYSIMEINGSIRKGVNTIKKQNGQVFLN